MTKKPDEISLNAVNLTLIDGRVKKLETAVRRLVRQQNKMLEQLEDIEMLGFQNQLNVHTDQIKEAAEWVIYLDRVTAQLGMQLDLFWMIRYVMEAVAMAPVLQQTALKNTGDRCTARLRETYASLSATIASTQTPETVKKEFDKQARAIMERYGLGDYFTA